MNFLLSKFGWFSKKILRKEDTTAQMINWGLVNRVGTQFAVN